MNRFKKYAPNVWVAECEKEHKRGDIIELTTKYGKEVECEVYSFLEERNGKYLYSIVRIEDMSYAERKAEKYSKSADLHSAKSSEWYEKSKEGRDFLVLGEPIKVGHHSESRHRALIKRNDDRMRNCVKEQDIADKYKSKAEYWEQKAKEINLSMPESLGYFEYKLEKDKEYHQGLKDGTIPREHSYSLTYAKKEVNETTKKLKMAKKLWA